MFILDRPYISDDLVEYLEQTEGSVLDNAWARRLAAGHRLNLTSCPADDRERICCINESSLSWVAAHIARPDMLATIRTMKDKAAMRQTVRTLYPDYVFSTVPYEKLRDIRVEDLQLPVVLKPSTGFFSLGVYPILQPSDWAAALTDLDSAAASWSETWGADVVNAHEFLIEQFITGDEFAVDAYFDGQGKPVILDILQHVFGSDADVTDRLYFTSAQVIRSHLASFTDFLSRVNERLHAHDFCVHVELRSDNGRIIPIEFNPMRFAGLCNTEIANYAYGLRTYEYFCDDIHPDWNQVLADTDDARYAMVVLTKPGFDPHLGYHFDYEGLLADYPQTLDLRRTDYAECGVFGFLFVRIDADDHTTFARLLNTTLDEYLTYD